MKLHSFNIDQLFYNKFSNFLTEVDTYRQILSSDELTRAEKFYHLEDQQRFIIARGYLRETLGKYLKIAPINIEFTYGNHEKPYLPHHQCQFNLAHTREAFLIAVTKQIQVGVDLELISRKVDIDGLANYALSDIEKKYIKSASPDKKPFSFFRCWTRKEAFLKAVGVGISIDLNSITTTINDDEILELEYENHTWQIRDLPMRDGHFLALAVKT